EAHIGRRFTLTDRSPVHAASKRSGTASQPKGGNPYEKVAAFTFSARVVTWAAIIGGQGDSAKACRLVADAGIPNCEFVFSNAFNDRCPPGQLLDTFLIVAAV